MKLQQYGPLASVLTKRFGTTAELSEAMERLGYGDVTAWLRPAPLDTFTLQLLIGLNRRGRLDQDFLGRLSNAFPDASPAVWTAGEALGIPSPQVPTGQQERAQIATTPHEADVESRSFFGKMFGWMQKKGDGSVETSLRYQDSFSPQTLLEVVRAGRSVARVRIGHHGAAQQPQSSGFLVAPDLLAIPDYLVLDESQARQLRSSPKAPRPVLSEVDLVATADFGFGQTLDEEVAIGCSVVACLDWQSGLAVLRLECAAPVAPLRLSTDDPRSDDHLHLIHHPYGGTQRFDLHQCVVSSVGAEWVEYVGPTRLGSAGGPLLDNNLRVVSYAYGRGANGIRFGPTIRSILDGLRDRHGELWEEIRRAQPHWKIIDPRLESALAEAEQRGRDNVPLVIRLSDESLRLDGVPDLQVSTATGRLMTARGSRRTLAALREHPNVASVEASPDGVFECAESMEMIRVATVHASTGFNERGDHALVAVIDNGVDVLHPSFRDGQGRTRIVALWDQLHPGAGGAAGFHSEEGAALVERYQLRYGKLYTAADIDGFIAAGFVPAEFPTTEHLVHGTLVTSIAAAAANRAASPAAWRRRRNF